MAYTVDEVAQSRGVLRLSLCVDVAGSGPVDLTATYPDLYPYVRPEVSAPHLQLSHHQNPFVKTLCLIGRSSRNWGTQDKLAWLLTKKLPVALSAGGTEPGPGPDRDALDEERQAEPFSDYYTKAPSAMVLIDGSWSLPVNQTCGNLLIAVGGALPPADDGQPHTLGAVLEVQGHDGSAIAAADERLHRRFPLPVSARWSRLDAPVSVDDPKAIWEAAEAADKYPSALRTANAEIRAVVFPEEVAWRNSADGWLFVVRQPGMTSAPPQSKKGKGKGRGRQRQQSTPTRYWAVRAGRAGPQDLAARVPELSGLSEHTVLIVGVGALGSSVADQLARASVGQLRLVDRDVLEPGNLVRHGGSFGQSGMPKAIAVANLVHDRSPYVEAEVTVINLGGIRPPHSDALNDADTLDSLVAGADLLVDATAELGLQHLLADTAADAGIGYVAVSATNGGWGGMVTRIRSDSEGCYTCLSYWLSDRTIALPPESPTTYVQPPGCADPTFTGSGFDLDQVAMQAVRTIVGELACGERPYPPAPHDVAVLALRKPDGTPILPTWSGYSLNRHPSCLAH